MSSIVNMEKKKRKRSSNTKQEQYEIYLNQMENDYTFRSGVTDPTIEDGYIKKKWVELATKLNCVGNGPSLSVEEWKKRFKDWKNSTRAKYRRLVDSQNRTGGGEPEKIKLTDLEEKGLAIWGKVTVTGTPTVLVSGGLQQTFSFPDNEGTSSCQAITEHISQEHIFTQGDMIFDCGRSTSPNENVIIDSEPSTSRNETVRLHCGASSSIHKPEYPLLENTGKIKNKFKKRPKSSTQNSTLHETTKCLLEVYKRQGDAIQNFCTAFCGMEEKRVKLKEKEIKLKERELEFKIKKFQILYPELDI